MTTPAVQRLGRAILLQGPALDDVAFLVGLGLRFRARVDGCPPSERHQRLLGMLAAAAAMSADGHSDVRSEGELPVWSPGDGGSANTDIAARMLNVSPRHVRRLADQLGGRRHGRTWMFDRAAVSAEAVRRREERTNDVHTV